MLLDQEGARHPGGGAGRGARGARSYSISAPQVRARRRQVAGSSRTEPAVAAGRPFFLSFARRVQSQPRGSDFSSSLWASCEQRRNLLSD